MVSVPVLLRVAAQTAHQKHRNVHDVPSASFSFGKPTENRRPGGRITRHATTSGGSATQEARIANAWQVAAARVAHLDAQAAQGRPAQPASMGWRHSKLPAGHTRYPSHTKPMPRRALFFPFPARSAGQGDSTPPTAPWLALRGRALQVPYVAAGEEHKGRQTWDMIYR